MANIKKIIVPVNGQKAEIDFTKIDSDIQNVDTKLSKLKYDIKNGSKSFRSALIFYSYPTDLNELYEVDLVVPVIGKYDLAVFGRDLCEPDCEARPDTIKIISQLNESYGTEVFGYVPIGCLTPEEDPEVDVSNLTIDEIKTRILSWKEMGAKGIFLDEFGYDYRTTRERQNEIVDFCHENSLNVIANAWVIDHVFGTKNYIVKAGNTKKHPGNPNNLECHLTEDDYVFFEHLMFYAPSKTKVKAEAPWDVYKVQEYYEKYYKKFKTQVFIANQVPTNASVDVQKELIRCSQIAGAVMQADVVSVAGEFWSSESTKTFYVEPFEIDGVKSRFIDVSFKGNEDTGYPIKFKSVIGSREYELVWNATGEEDTVYSPDKNYALVNSERDFPLNVSAEKLIYQNYDITATHNFKNGINLNGSKLIGLPDGTLTWNDKNIVRSVNNVTADASGNVKLQVGTGGAVTGEIKWFAFNEAPDGYLVCNGAKVSCETYADLFAVIGTTYGSSASVKAKSKFGTAVFDGEDGNSIRVTVATNADDATSFDVSTYFKGSLVETQTVKKATELVNNSYVKWNTSVALVAGDDVTFTGGTGTTFNLPNLIDKFAQGSTTVGTYKSAGLPNITGKIPEFDNSVIANSSGAFYAGATYYAWNPTGSSDSEATDIYLDASRSSSIYGNSTTVQPPALTLLPCIKY